MSPFPTDFQAVSPALDWVHIPTPGDHYSPSTGSALMTVIYEVSRCHEVAGGRTRVMVSDGTYPDYYPVGRVVPVRASRPPNRPMKVFDALAGRLGVPRQFSARPYKCPADAIPSDFEGVVFVHNGPQALPLVRRRAPRCRLYLYAHNDLLKTYGRRESERLLAHADGVICVSDFIRGVMAEKAPAAACKLKVVLNGVDTQAFTSMSTPMVNPDPVILFVGRVVPQKGVHVLIDAARRLADEAVRFRLVIVGSGGFDANSLLSDYEQNLRERAVPLGDRVVFRPFTERAGVPALYRDADVGCFPAMWDEPLGLTVLESMASGRATVTTRRGGIPEVGGDAVAYAEPLTAAGLAATLRPLLTDAAACTVAGRRARQRAELFDWSRVYPRLNAALEGVLGKKSSS